MFLFNTRPNLLSIRRHWDLSIPCLKEFHAGTWNHSHRHCGLVFNRERREGLHGKDLNDTILEVD